MQRLSNLAVAEFVRVVQVVGCHDDSEVAFTLEVGEHIQTAECEIGSSRVVGSSSKKIFGSWTRPRLAKISADSREMCLRLRKNACRHWEQRNGNRLKQYPPFVLRRVWTPEKAQLTMWQANQLRLRRPDLLPPDLLR
jgi:hypothetical protein